MPMTSMKTETSASFSGTSPLTTFYQVGEIVAVQFRVLEDNDDLLKFASFEDRQVGVLRIAKEAVLALAPERDEGGSLHVPRADAANRRRRLVVILCSLQKGVVAPA
jgi:hypothetical protein